MEHSLKDADRQGPANYKSFNLYTRVADATRRRMRKGLKLGCGGFFTL